METVLTFAFVVLWLFVFYKAAVGYGRNWRKFAEQMRTQITGECVVRGLGILFPPLGALMGYVK